MKVTIEVTTVSEARQSIVLLNAYIASVDGTSGADKPAKKAPPAPVVEDDDEDEEEEAPAKKTPPARGGAAKKAAKKSAPVEVEEDDDEEEDDDAEDGADPLADILDAPAKGEAKAAKPRRSLEDIREEARRFASKHSTEKLVAILEEKFGVSRIADIPASKFDDAYAALLFAGSKPKKSE